MLIGLGTSVSALSQSVRGYELEREMPAFLDEIQKELTYPMAWGNSATTNFGDWRAEARAIVVEAMMAPPLRAAGYDPKVVAEEKRDGYTARKLEFNLTRYSRVNAYMLVPDGEDPSQRWCCFMTTAGTTPSVRRR